MDKHETLQSPSSCLKYISAPFDMNIIYYTQKAIIKIYIYIYI